jgi:hypothetical protein
MPLGAYLVYYSQKKDRNPKFVCDMMRKEVSSMLTCSNILFFLVFVFFSQG